MAGMKEIGIRLAIRREGHFVNAYLANQGTMDNAMLIGSIMSSACDRNHDIWERWKALMTDTLRDAIAEKFGQNPEFTEAPAPPNERAGQA